MLQFKSGDDSPLEKRKVYSTYVVQNYALWNFACTLANKRCIRELYAHSQKFLKYCTDATLTVL